MKREWKPGDVAMVTCEGDAPTVMLREAGNNGWHDAEGTYYWDRAVGQWELTDIRRLVVIDLEDVLAVERLQDCYITAERQGLSGLSMAAALREFASPTPPRPDEPLGLGAVVEDAEGERWVRTFEHGMMPWGSTETTSTNGRHVKFGEGGISTRAWGDIPVVRVLSEGVIP